MANAMQDMASGSDAVLQLQRNVAAAPDVQQHQKNIMQEEALKIDQEKATLGKTVMENTIRQTEFQANQEAIQKMQQLAGTPEYKNAKDFEQAKQISALFANMGKPVEAEAAMTRAEALQTSSYLNDIKQYDAQSRAIQSAASVIENMLPDKVKDAVEALPPPAKKALIDSIGAVNYANMNGAQVQKAASELMWSTSGKLGEMAIQAKQLIATERLAEIQARILSEERISIARIAAGSARAAGKEESRAEKTWKDYRGEVVSLDKDFLAAEKERETEIKIAKEAAAASAPGPISRAFGVKETPAQKEYAALVQDRLDKQKQYWDEKRVLAQHSGDKEEIARVEAAYAKTFPKETPSPAAEETPKPDAKPSAATPSQVAPSANVPSNKPASGQQAAPPEAVQQLMADPSEKNKKFFKETFGYLPDMPSSTPKQKSRGELLQEKVAADRAAAVKKEEARVASEAARLKKEEADKAEEERKKKARGAATLQSIYGAKSRLNDMVR